MVYQPAMLVYQRVVTNSTFRGTYLGTFDCLAGEAIFTMLGTGTVQAVTMLLGMFCHTFNMV